MRGFFILITRWQAPMLPDMTQLRKVYEAEGLSPTEINLEAKSNKQCHPFDEVLTMTQGEMFVNVTGNKLLLRPGDRIMIPSNTSYELSVHGDKCAFLWASKIF